MTAKLRSYSTQDDLNALIIPGCLPIKTRSDHNLLGCLVLTRSLTTGTSMGLIKEFKEFAMRGNVVDMAVGIIIGGAFGKIVSSLVKDIIMPPIGKLIGGVNFGELKMSLGETKKPDGEIVEAFINYGAFLQTTFDFLIVALAVFGMIKMMNRATSAMKPEKKAAAPTKKDCPKCCSSISINASRCPNCTSEL